MSFDVILAPSARQDLRSILRYISERSRQGAEAWYRRWLDVLRFLTHSAAGCSLAPESQHYSEEIRQFTFKTRYGRRYRAVFVVRDNKVLVLHIRVAGQDLIRPDEMNIPDPSSS